MDRKKQKNLILIYVESLENTYSDPSIFKQDLLKDLNKIDGISFENFAEVPGANWTIAGIVASQCGIPLKPVFMADGNAQGEILNSFLAKTICLGDVLKENGYENYFLGGASLLFAGKGKFLLNHGYSKAMGKEEWVDSGKYNSNDFNEWGLDDDDLFLEAKIQLEALIKSKKPFNLTLLTVNTHFPAGFISKACKKAGGQDYEDIVGCTAKEISDFVNYAKNKGYLENTNIVILGDHLSMPNTVYKKLETIENRTIYNLWISADKHTKNREEIVHFDFAPTILEFIGFDIEGNQYGLGYTALGKLDKPLDRNRVDYIKENVGKPSSFYRSLWLPKKN